MGLCSAVLFLGIRGFLLAAHRVTSRPMNVLRRSLRSRTTSPPSVRQNPSTSSRSILSPSLLAGRAQQRYEEDSWRRLRSKAWKPFLLMSSRNASLVYSAHAPVFVSKIPPPYLQGDCWAGPDSASAPSPTRGKVGGSRVSFRRFTRPRKDL